MSTKITSVNELFNMLNEVNDHEDIFARASLDITLKPFISLAIDNGKLCKY